MGIIWKEKWGQTIALAELREKAVCNDIVIFKHFITLQVKLKKIKGSGFLKLKLSPSEVRKCFPWLTKLFMIFQKNLVC